MMEVQRCEIFFHVVFPACAKRRAYIKIGGNKLIGFEKIIAEKVLFGLENKP